MKDFERIDRLEEEYATLKRDISETTDQVSKLITVVKNQNEDVRHALRIADDSVAIAKDDIKRLDRR